MSAFIQALSALFVLLALPFAQVAPEVVTIVILDTSGSMEGPRLEQALHVVREAASAMPPSPETPLILIAFDKKVRFREVFTNPGALDASLRTVKANGATSLASGLHAAAQTLQPYLEASNLVVMIVTDGEDTVDPSSVPAAEAELDAVFAQRKKEQRPSSIYVQRWSGANEAFVKGLTSKSAALGVEIIDLESELPVNVAIDPRASARAISWTEASSEHAIRACVGVEFGIAGANIQEPLQFEVHAEPTGARVVGDSTLQISSAGGELAFELAPQGECDSLDLRLAFRLLTKRIDRRRIFSTLKRASIVLHVDVPRVLVSLESHLTPRDVRWTREGRIACDLELTAIAQPPWGSPIELGVEFSPTATGPHVLSLSGAGEAVETYRIDFDAAAAGQEREVTARLAPVQLPWPLVLSDRAGSCAPTATVALPRERHVQLLAEVHVTREPRWALLSRNRVALEAEVAITTDGEDIDGIETTVSHPAILPSGNRSANFEDGRAIVPIRLELSSNPSERATFDLRVEAPSRPGFSLEPAVAHLEVQTPGAATLQLALEDQQPGSSLHLDGTPWFGTLHVTPIISGALEPGAEQGLSVRIEAPGSEQGIEVPAGAASDLSLVVPEVIPPPFEDSIHRFEVRATLPSGVVSVQPVANGVLEATVSARYRRAILMGGAGLTLLVVVFLGFLIYTRSTSSRPRTLEGLSS